MKCHILAAFFIANSATAQTETPTQAFMDSTAYTLTYVKAAAVAESCGLRPHNWALAEIGAMITIVEQTAQNIWGKNGGVVAPAGKPAQDARVNTLVQTYRAALVLAPGECAGFETTMNLREMDKIIFWSSGQTENQR